MTASVVRKPGSWPIYVSQGATWRETYTWALRDTVTGEITGPIDFTGWTAKGQVRRLKSKSSELYAEMSFELEPADGIIHASLTAAQTDAILSNGYYDIEMTGPSDEVVRIAQGTVVLDVGVTK